MCVGWLPRERQQRSFRVEAAGMRLTTRHTPKNKPKSPNKQQNHASAPTIASRSIHLVVYGTRRLEHLLPKPMRSSRVYCRPVHKDIIRDLRKPAYLVHHARRQEAEVACC